MTERKAGITKRKNMAKKKISILVLTHNNMASERKCFDGLKELAKRPDVFEINILDNGSVDGTDDYLKKFLKGIPKTKLFFSPENLGCANGRRELLRAAKGDVILFLDSDVKIISGKFVDKLKLGLEKQKAGIIGFEAFNLNRQKMEFENLPKNFEGPADYVSGFCQMFKKEILKKCRIDSFYNPYFAEDVDFCFQAKQAGFKIFALPQKNSGVEHKWSCTKNGNYAENRKKLDYLFKKFDLYPKKNLFEKFFLLKRKLIRGIDKRAGKIGLFIKKINPKLYLVIKKIMK